MVASNHEMLHHAFRSKQSPNQEFGDSTLLGGGTLEDNSVDYGRDQIALEVRKLFAWARAGSRLVGRSVSFCEHVRVDWLKVTQEINTDDSKLKIEKAKFDLQFILSNFSQTTIVC